MKAEIFVRKNSWRDYAALTKPRVVLLHLVTTAAAMFIASEDFPRLSILIATLVGGAAVAGAANVLNCYFDRDIDRMMARTLRRPLPAGRVSPDDAFIFGLIAGLAGVWVLTRFVGIWVAVLAIAAMLYYVLLYTLLLKRRSPWSTVIGSGAGAFPPLIGWVAVTGHVALTPFLLFAIVALWSPPHFWSLAIFRQREYETAGLRVTPAAHTPFLITLFSVSLAIVTLWLVKIAGLGPLYAAAALALNAVLIVLASRVKTNRDLQPARGLYAYSIMYLFLIFGFMLIDKLLLV
jgi:protoheme IX farnesyltransferase